MSPAGGLVDGYAVSVTRIRKPLGLLTARPKMNAEDWEGARGVECPKCHREVLRLVAGLCSGCANVVDAQTAEQMEDKAERRYYAARLRKGDMSLKDLRNLAKEG